MRFADAAPVLRPLGAELNNAGGRVCVNRPGLTALSFRHGESLNEIAKVNQTPEDSTVRIEITLPFTPVPMARARSGRNGVHYTPAKQRAYMTTVRHFLKGEVMKQAWRPGPKQALQLSVVFVMERARSNKTAHHIQKPDLSNLIKLLEDAGNGVLYHDDSQITSIFAHKVWGLPPRTVVTLETVDR